jgi:hypothetical protein
MQTSRHPSPSVRRAEACGMRNAAACLAGVPNVRRMSSPIDAFDVEQNSMATRSGHLERRPRSEARDWNSSQGSVLSLCVRTSAHQPEDSPTWAGVVRRERRYPCDPIGRPTPKEEAAPRRQPRDPGPSRTNIAHPLRLLPCLGTLGCPPQRAVPQRPPQKAFVGCEGILNSQTRRPVAHGASAIRGARIA